MTRFFCSLVYNFLNCRQSYKLGYFMKLDCIRERSSGWKITSVLSALWAGLLLLGGCGGGQSERTAETSGDEALPYHIVTTVGMITDVVKEVAGDRANVTGLIGEGVDPHLYNPTRSDVVQLSEADVVFYNGLQLEGKMIDVLIRVARDGTSVRAVTEAILEEGDYVMVDEADHFDPHVWMDVQGWMQAVPVVVATLSAYDPAHAEQYEKNGEGYLERLRDLEAYARRSFESIPENRRVLITAHDAFTYLGRAYGIEVRGIQGISTESEAGLKDIESLIQFLVDREIPAVFVETSVADKNVRALVEGSRARGHDLKIGGSLFSDAMGQAGTYEGTYIGMLDHNITTITRALGGEAPAQGMLGLLGSAE